MRLNKLNKHILFSFFIILLLFPYYSDPIYIYGLWHLYKKKHLYENDS